MENANTTVNKYLLQKYLLKKQRKETYLTYIKKLGVQSVPKQRGVYSQKSSRPLPMNSTNIKPS